MPQAQKEYDLGGIFEVGEDLFGKPKEPPRNEAAIAATEQLAKAGGYEKKKTPSGRAGIYGQVPSVSAGFGKAALETASGIPGLKTVQRKLAGMTPEQFEGARKSATERKGTAEKFGGVLEDIAESTAVGEGLGVVGKAALGAFKGTAAGKATATALKSYAGRKLATFFGSSPLESKAVRGKIAEIVPVALDEGIPATWKKWAAQAEAAVERKGKAVEQAVAQHGDVWAPLEPTMKALEELEAKATIQVQASTQGFKSGTSVATATKPEIIAVRDRALLNQVKAFRTELQRIESVYGNQVPARVLHDLKSSWNKYSKFSKTGTTRDLILNAKEEVARGVTGAIRDTLSVATPEIADVDRAYHITKDLYASIIEKALESSGKVEQQVATQVGAQLRRYTVGGVSGGAAVGGYAGYKREGIPGAVAGTIVGGLVGRKLQIAFQSPAWKTLGPRVANRLAKVLTEGTKAEQQQYVGNLLVRLKSEEGKLVVGPTRVGEKFRAAQRTESELAAERKALAQVKKPRHMHPIGAEEGAQIRRQAEKMAKQAEPVFQQMEEEGQFAGERVTFRGAR